MQLECEGRKDSTDCRLPRPDSLPLTQLRCLPSCRESLLKATSLPPPPSYSCLLILVDSLSMSAAPLAHEL